MHEDLERLGTIYDEFATRPLDRLMNLWRDDARIEMDDMVLERLGIDADLDYIRRHLCTEPSFNKGRAPDDLRKALCM